MRFTPRYIHQGITVLNFLNFIPIFKKFLLCITAFLKKISQNVLIPGQNVLIPNGITFII